MVAARTVPGWVTQLQGWWSWHPPVSPSPAGPGVNTERKWAEAIKICNPPLNSALCPMVEVYCKLKRITSEGCICVSFSKQSEGFLQKDEIPPSRTDFLLQCYLASRQKWTHVSTPTQRLFSLLLEFYLPIHWTSFCKIEICQKNTYILPILLCLSSLSHLSLVLSVPFIQSIRGAFRGVSQQYISIFITRASNKDCPLWTQEARLPFFSKIGWREN